MEGSGEVPAERGVARCDVTPARPTDTPRSPDATVFSVPDVCSRDGSGAGRYGFRVERCQITIDLDPKVASMLAARAAEANISE